MAKNNKRKVKKERQIWEEIAIKPEIGEIKDKQTKEIWDDRKKTGPENKKLETGQKPDTNERKMLKK